MLKIESSISAADTMSLFQHEEMKKIKLFQNYIVQWNEYTTNIYYGMKLALLQLKVVLLKLGSLKKIINIYAPTFKHSFLCISSPIVWLSLWP